jgi:uncharacterized membrane protein YgdD (TMEM256/DUF423 family)
MNASTQTKNLLSIASLMMVLAISIGAFGAHGLAPYLDEYGNTIFSKGSSYWFYNTAGLFAIAFMTSLKIDTKNLIRGFWFVLVGTMIFSISLFALALTHIKVLGAITPIGGTTMIIGWLLVAFAIRK